MGTSTTLFYFVLITAFFSLVAEHIYNTHKQNNRRTKESFIAYREPMANYCKPKMVVSEKVNNPFNTCQPAVEQQKRIRMENIVKNSKYNQLPGYGNTSLEYNLL